MPDVPATLEGLDRTVEALTGWGVPFRIDPVLEPIGFGFAASLGRYLEVRRRYPDAEMMMGVGNLTELTDVDSAGVNVLLLGFCQEVGIRSVLTTEVINWCRSCVRELDLARRLVYYACTQRVLPKHLEPDLVLLRDPKLREHGEATLARAGGARHRPQLPPVRRGAACCTSSTARCTCKGPTRSRCSTQMQQREADRPVARLLPGLRDGQGGDGADAGQELRAGPGAALGLPDRAGREPSR